MASSTDRRQSSEHSSLPRTQSSESTTSYLAYPVSHVASALYRRLTEPQLPSPLRSMHKRQQSNGGAVLDSPTTSNGFYQVPKRTASPFAPPPLTGLSLRGHKNPRYQLLTRTVAEEIRLLLPPRLQLSTDWTLAYSIEQHGVSLATLYSKCERFAGSRHGFVLVVKDSAGGIFGAYLTDPPQPSPHYYGTGECFLWRATVLPASAILSNLPPPPSADTTNVTRSTTLRSGSYYQDTGHDLLSPWTPPISPEPPVDEGETNGHTKPQTNSNGNRKPSTSSTTAGGGFLSPSSDPHSPSNPQADVPERIRFKAFPYSGVNDYMIFCESDYLSVGGGDGKYGLWLDSVLERGVSAGCPTFGNEPLSEEGEKFEVLGVEVWFVGS